jgi:ribose transport system substrate-binding protein
MGMFPNLEINLNPTILMKRRLYLFINTFLFISIFMFSSCGGAGDSSTDEGSETASKGTIGVSVLTLGNPFFSVIAENVKSEAAKHGYDVIVVDGNRNVQRQANQIDDFLTKGVAAIVLNPCDRISTGAAIKKANDAGIPVFTCDLKCVAEGAEVISHVGSDNLQGGKLAGEAMIEALGDEGGKVLVVHFPQANSCQLRVQGFTEVINAHNLDRETGKIVVVSELDGGGVRDEGYKVTEDTLQAHPDLTGIFAINDPSALGARAALEKAGKQEQVKIVAFDGQPEGKQAIKEGKIYADPVQFPDKIGVRTVELIMAYFNGEEVPSEVLIPTELFKQEDGLKDPTLE